MISERPVEELRASQEVRDQLRQIWYFHPNESIRRVVTIATPQRGTEFSNSTTQWLARKLIRLTKAFAQSTQRLFADNADLRSSPLLSINNSIESLSPDSPVLPLMLRSPHPAWVSYDNIVGVLPEGDMIGRVSAAGDGVVKYESAHLEDATSEAIVPEDHVKIHRHPRTILEVRRILVTHLSQLRAEAMRPPLR